MVKKVCKFNLTKEELDVFLRYAKCTMQEIEEHTTPGDDTIVLRSALNKLIRAHKSMKRKAKKKLTK